MITSVCQSEAGCVSKLNWPFLYQALQLILCLTCYVVQISVQAVTTLWQHMNTLLELRDSIRYVQCFPAYFFFSLNSNSHDWLPCTTGPCAQFPTSCFHVSWLRWWLADVVKALVTLTNGPFQDYNVHPQFKWTYSTSFIISFSVS